MDTKAYLHSVVASTDATLVVVPGTSDQGGHDLQGWTHWFMQWFRDVQVADYPATVWPLCGGWRADTYDVSRDKAVAVTVELVGRTPGKVVLFGYSQGAEAAWHAAAQLLQLGIKRADELELVVWAHPQHPTGLKAQLKRHHPLVSWMLQRFCGVAANGAVHERELRGVRVTSLAIMGDPITAFEVWWRNPVGFVLNFLTGFFMIHSGLGSQGAAQLAALEVREVRQAADDAVVHVTLDAAHPAEQAYALCGRTPGRGIIWCLAMVAPRTVPGEKPASLWAVRKNWRAAMVHIAGDAVSSEKKLAV